MKRRYFVISFVTMGLVASCSAQQRASETPSSTAVNSANSTPANSTSTNPAQANATTATPNASSQAIAPQVENEPVFASNGIAIRGTDPVAYFEESKPVPGDPAYTHEWMGVTWQFSSAANRDRFIANPKQYAPQYGGFCAFAVANGYTASIDPEAWTIYNGKLYLNYNLSVRDRWSRDIPGNVSKGDANWPDAAKEFRG